VVGRLGILTLECTLICTANLHKFLQKIRHERREDLISKRTALGAFNVQPLGCPTFLSPAIYCSSCVQNMYIIDKSLAQNICTNSRLQDPGFVIRTYCTYRLVHIFVYFSSRLFLKSDAQLVPNGCPTGAQQVPNWYPSDSQH